MWLISVYLIEAAAEHKEFTYFSAYEHEPGEIVKITVRGKKADGLVITCESAREARQDVRAKPFILQKIAGKGKRILTKAFLRAAFEIAAYQATSVGAVLAALMPAAVLEKIDSLWEAGDGETGLGRAPSSSSPQGAPPRAKDPDIAYVVGSREARLAQYVSFIEEMVTKSKSTLIIAPTVVEAERIARRLPKAALFHGGLTKKSARETWNHIARVKKPITVVGTPIALSLPRERWGAIVLERALARGYERQSRPFISVRVAAEKLAQALGAQLIIGSSVVPVEDALDGIRDMKNGIWEKNKSYLSIIDMKSDPHTPYFISHFPKPSFNLFSSQAKEKISQALEQGENALLIAARHGLAPHTSCDDCGTPLSCPRCSAGLTLKEAKDSISKPFIGNYRRWFECPYCGFVEKVNILCPVCGSWRLSMTGVGLQLIAREAEKLFGNAKILVADEKIIEHSKKIKTLAEALEHSKGAILCATEGALPYLSAGSSLDIGKAPDVLPMAVVVSIDSMLYAPEYSVSERTLSFLRELEGVSSELLVQTRLPAHPVLEALTGDAKTFYDRELQLRKKFGYPPFVILIRLTVSGNRERTQSQADTIAKALERFKPLRYSGRSSRKNHMREHILLRLPKNQWIDQKLLAFIRSLPPSVEARVNPRNLISD